MLLLARLEGKKYGEICGEARNCCEDNNVRISLEADDCLLVLSGSNIACKYAVFLWWMSIS